MKRKMAAVFVGLSALAIMAQMVNPDHPHRVTLSDISPDQLQAVLGGLGVTNVATNDLVSVRIGCPLGAPARAVIYAR